MSKYRFTADMSAETRDKMSLLKGFFTVKERRNVTYAEVLEGIINEAHARYFPPKKILEVKKTTKKEDSLRNFVMDQKDIFTPKEAQVATGGSESVVAKGLRKLVEEGVINKAGKGKYAVVTKKA